MTTHTITQARAHLDDLLDEAENDVVQIRRNRKPAAALISWEAFESLIESLEILSDHETMEGIRQGEADIKAGRLYDWDEVKKTLEPVAFA